MKHTFVSSANTPADSLRQDLLQAERETTLLRRQKSNLLPLLERLDRLHVGLDELEQAGVDVRAERTRWSSLGAQLRESLPRVLRHANEGIAGLRADREELRPSPDRWWWYLDELLGAQRKEQFRTSLTRLGVAIVVICALGAIAYFALRPDPITWAKLRLLGDADRAIQEDRPSEALVLYRQATEVDPADPEPWLRMGTTLEQLGDGAGAMAAFSAAQERFENQALYELSLGRVYIELRQPESALPHALLATELAPESPQAFFVLAGAYEGIGERQKAITALEKTEALAEAADDLTMVATVRVRLATLLQTVEFPGPSPGATVPHTPTP